MKKVVLGWDALPTILLAGGYVLPRAVELISHAEYYPNWPKETWPIDPKTGEKLQQITVAEYMQELKKKKAKTAFKSWQVLRRLLHLKKINEKK